MAVSAALLGALASPAAAGPLSLNDAVNLALSANPAIAAAQAQLDQAQATLAQNRAARRFQLTFLSSPSVSNADVYQPPPASETFAAIQNSVDLPIPTGGKPGSLIAQASDQADAAAAQFLGAQVLLAAQVRRAYFDLLRAQALAVGAGEQLQSAQQALVNAQNRYKAGDVAQLDVLQAQGPVAAAQASAVQADAAAATALETLNSLLGRALDAPADLVDVPDAPQAGPPITLERARQMALSISPDIEAAVDDVLAAQAGVDAAQAWRDPTLSLQAIDLRSKDATSFSREDTLQAQVSVPIDDGGAGRASVDAAKAALAEASAQEELMRQHVLLTVSTAYSDASSSTAALTAAASARDIAQTTYDKTLLGYRNGVSPLVDLLSAQNALGQARIAYIQALYDAAESRADLDALTLAPSFAAPGPMQSGDQEGQ